MFSARDFPAAEVLKNRGSVAGCSYLRSPCAGSKNAFACFEEPHEWDSLLPAVQTKNLDTPVRRERRTVERPRAEQFVDQRRDAVPEQASHRFQMKATGPTTNRSRACG